MEARDIVEAALRRELVGPAEDEAPRGRPLDTNAGFVHFATWEDARGPWHDALTGEEILSEIEPLRRYGVGVLHPRGSVAGAEPDLELSGVTGLPADDDIADAITIPQLTIGPAPEADGDDFDLSDANSFHPSAMAISFKARLAGGGLLVTARAASYDGFAVRVHGAKRDRRWWVRRPFALSATVDGTDLSARTQRLIALDALCEG